MSYKAILLTFIVTIGSIQPAWSQPETKLQPTGRVTDEFGISVALNGNYALIGAAGEDEGRGAAYLFRLEGTTWIQEARLTASDRDVGDEFGFSVALEGDRALIGAWEDDDVRGSAYVFRRDGTIWTQEAKLTTSRRNVGDWVGVSVSLSGNRALLGAFRNAENGAEAGAAYVFRRDGQAWAQEAKLLAPDGAAGDEFGVSVALSGELALVGSYKADAPDTWSGAAYVYRLEGTAWIFEAKLTASDGGFGDRLGRAVTLTSDYALVGAPYADEKGSDSGAAYVFKRTGSSWVEEARFAPSEGSVYFGSDISFNDNRVLVGATHDIGQSPSSGAAYVFRKDQSEWIQEAKMIASDGETNDWFGVSVSLSRDRAIVGAFRDDNDESGMGSAYIYRVPTAASSEPSPSFSATLRQNYPNPASTETSISFSLEDAQTIQLELFDALGRRIAILSSGHHAAGTHEVSFDTSKLSEGMYLYRLSTGTDARTKLLSIVRTP